MSDTDSRAMSHGKVKVERQGMVGTIILDRPQAYNSMDMDLMRDLAEAVETLRWDDQVRAVAVTAQGKAFCAGGDIKSMLGSEQPDRAAYLYIQELTKHLHLLITGIREMPKLVIAGVNGIAAGAGFSLALACDLVLASEKARFDCAYVRAGLTPDGGCTNFLVRHLGPKQALEAIVAGKVFSAKEALDLGLVNRVCAPESVREQTQAWAEELAQGPAQAIARAKQLVTAAQDISFEQLIELERRAIIASAAGDEFKEGASAFSEKRKPRFVK